MSKNNTELLERYNDCVQNDRPELLTDRKIIVFTCGSIYLLYIAYFFCRHKGMLKGLNKFLVFSWMVEQAINLMSTIFLSKIAIINFIWLLSNFFNIVLWWLIVFSIKTMAIYMDNNYKSEQ